jgi:putative DNA primase/helicase
MLGERVGLLGLREIERSSFALSGIIGKTLLVSTEQPSDYMQSTHILNRLISGEHVHVDRKFRDPLELQSRAKILWAMNKPPRQQDLEDGIFRRIKVVSFGEMKGDPDPTIKQKLAGEGAGILGWALEGLARLNKRGRFDIPASVEQATREYQDKNDVPAAFVDECCIKQADAKVQSSELYEAYKFWSQKSGHTPKSSTSIADDWKRLGFTWAQSNGRKYWKGVGLLSRSSE